MFSMQDHPESSDREVLVERANSAKRRRLYLLCHRHVPQVGFARSHRPIQHVDPRKGHGREVYHDGYL